ncbi:MAG: DUF4280 domain-containing protein [Holosporales bacterium]|nr:DUF4280 domain-containing protein [Holosporales bacterium]
MSIAVNGALCQCSFGTTPSPLVVVPKARVFAGGLPVATITDFIPVVNIATFGMCSALSNPTVAAATAAAFGVLTPMPCAPAVTSPWIPTKPAVLSSLCPVACNGDTCMCMWGGIVKIIMPGQCSVL